MIRDEDRTDPLREGRIGRYQLIGRLATGGMAQIYLALSGELSGFRTLVVVKRILPHLASNPEFIRMFFDEARIVARLDHPNIVRIIEVGHDGDEYFLAMEVVQGRPLSAVLRKAVKRNSPLTHAQSAFIVAQAADGLGYAHNLADADGHPLNVVHRDVSPQNILVSFEGAVKIIDFGVARALGRVTETIPGGLKGKIQYMAPEQTSAGRVDQRSDVFALGVVLWESLCGRRLFRRDSELETMRAIVDEPILLPSKIGPISPRLEYIVMRALEKDPANRFQSAEEMALALERYAFASDGFSPLQIATTMKSLFWSDYTRWKRTVAAAMDLQGDPEEWHNISGTFLQPPTADPQTRGPTVALHPRAARGPVGLVGAAEARASGKTSEHSEHSQHSEPSTQFTLPDAFGRYSRRWVTSGIVVGGLLVGLGILALPRPKTTVTVVRPSSGETTPVESLAVRSQTHPAVTTEEHDLPTANPSPSPGPVFNSKHPVVRKGGPRVDAFAQAIRPAKAGPGRSRPSKSNPVRSARGAAAAPVRAPAGSIACAITVATHPWSEVWIDGQNTKRHTPYSESISCGKHKLAFRRVDLDTERTVAITVRPGETFKQWFPLEGE